MCLAFVACSVGKRAASSPHSNTCTICLYMYIYKHVIYAYIYIYIYISAALAMCGRVATLTHRRTSLFHCNTLQHTLQHTHIYRATTVRPRRHTHAPSHQFQISLPHDSARKCDRCVCVCVHHSATCACLTRAPTHTHHGATWYNCWCTCGRGGDRAGSMLGNAKRKRGPRRNAWRPRCGCVYICNARRPQC